MKSQYNFILNALYLAIALVLPTSGYTQGGSGGAGEAAGL